MYPEIKQQHTPRRSNLTMKLEYSPPLPQGSGWCVGMTSMSAVRTRSAFWQCPVQLMQRDQNAAWTWIRRPDSQTSTARNWTAAPDNDACDVLWLGTAAILWDIVELVWDKRVRLQHWTVLQVCKFIVHQAAQDHIITVRNEVYAAAVHCGSAYCHRCR